MIDFICSYYNRNDEVINVIYDTSLEETLIVNVDTKQVEIISEIKNMRLDMYCFIADNFFCFKEVNTESMMIDEEEIEYIKDECADSSRFIEALKENNIKIEEI